MAGLHRSIKGDVAVEYLKKFPKNSKISIARMLTKKYPLLFHNVESTRTMLRTYTGSIGV